MWVDLLGMWVDSLGMWGCLCGVCWSFVGLPLGRVLLGLGVSFGFCGCS
jgi:hypothetical protein